MQFSFIPLTAIMVLCVSASLACLFALLLEKLTGHTFGRYRLVFAALFLSAAIVCLSLLLIFVPMTGVFSLVDIAYYSGIFLLGFAGAFFFRFVGLPLMILYGAFAGVLFFSVSLWAGPAIFSYELEISPEQAFLNGIPLAVEQNSIVSDYRKNNVYLEFSAVAAPEALLLPVSIIGIKPLKINSQAMGEFYMPEFSNNFLRILFSIIERIQRFSSKLVGSSDGETFRQFFAEIPLAGFYPVIYMISPRIQGFELTFSVSRLL